ncbi:hypothetical protein P280DRAFT_518276 [Massarina eburnea CBS 473.64]|uniref:Uncharacterized protein n=1 Tax=Massarina eburnea CBS 473.64 TaxID=1395130 RepID=A0A6A6S0R1_9PLEO|nr:hypothetical protein P280DRAFT_518276 [Massarina eburnea CBS 473.64]
MQFPQLTTPHAPQPLKTKPATAEYMANIDLASKCPYGVVNLNAMAEAHPILAASAKPFHWQLDNWLSAHYLSVGIHVLTSYDNEPLGRRIRSGEDLCMLVCAYSNARALKQRSSKKQMDNELYFYGQVPDREAGAEAARLMRSESTIQAMMNGADAIRHSN